MLYRPISRPSTTIFASNTESGWIFTRSFTQWTTIGTTWRLHFSQSFLPGDPDGGRLVMETIQISDTQSLCACTDVTLQDRRVRDKAAQCYCLEVTKQPADTKTLIQRLCPTTSTMPGTGHDLIICLRSLTLLALWSVSFRTCIAHLLFMILYVIAQVQCSFESNI